MKYCVFCVVAGLTAVSYGGLFDSALNAVNKATEVVNKVDEAKKTVENPQAAVTPTETPTASSQPAATPAPAAKAAPQGQPPVPPGYDQPPSYAGTSSSSGAAAPRTAAKEPNLTSNEALASYEEFSKMISDAKEKGYKVSEPYYMASVVKFMEVPKSTVVKWRAELEKSIADAKVAFEEKEAAANSAHQKKLGEMKELAAKYDSFAVKFQADVAVCKKAVADLIAKYPKSLGDSQHKDGFSCPAMYNNDVKDYLEKKTSGLYESDINEFNLDFEIGRLKGYLENVEGETTDRASERRGQQQETVATAGELASVDSVALREQTEDCLQQMNAMVTRDIKSQVDSQLSIETQKQPPTVSYEFANQIRSADVRSPEEAQALLQKIKDEIENNAKLAAERENLIKKLAASDVSTWLADLEKYPNDEKRDAVVGDALSARFGLGAPKGRDLEGIKTLIPALYSKERQQELLKGYKTSLSMIIAIASADREVGKRLLKDDTDWAFRSIRDGGERAYLALLDQETDMDVLMAVYEKQDRINFTYEANAKRSGEMTAGDMLDKMWKDDQNRRGAGYGRLGLWMLDNCGKEFCRRAEKLTEARRAAAKNQTFLMKDFYLGMPHRDSKLVMKNWDEKKGNVAASFGTFNNGTLSEISFGGKARLEYLGVKKDGLAGIEEFVEKYIPGGMESVGELQVGATAEAGYDPENPEVEVKTWWYTNCPKYDCRIRMYDSGTICVVYTGDEDSPELDFSSVK